MLASRHGAPFFAFRVPNADPRDMKALSLLPIGSGEDVVVGLVMLRCVPIDGTGRLVPVYMTSVELGHPW